MFLLMPEIFRKAYLAFFDFIKYLRRKIMRAYYKMKRKSHIFVKIMRFLVRYVAIVLSCRILYLGMREYFQVEGCIFCSEFTDKASHRVYKYLQSDEFLLMLNNFHGFVDWLITIQTIDLVGIEL